MSLNEIKGIGPKTLTLLNKLMIFTIDDLIRYFPYRYNVYSPSNLLEADENTTIVISGTVTSNPVVSYIKRNFNRVSFKFETNNILCNVTIFNRAFLAANIKIGKQLTLIGKYDHKKNTFTASDLKFTFLTHTMVEPVYHLINGLTNSSINKYINLVLESTQTLPDILPHDIVSKYQLLNSYEAIKEIHNPTSAAQLKNSQLRLKYEELFVFMFKINLLKFKNQVFDDFVIKEVDEEKINDIKKLAPFTLTNDQNKALSDIINDFKSPHRMNRLILGDVGSGKTIVAFMAMIINYFAGYQSALLSPTEVLAKQHYENFKNLIANTNLRVELLIGSIPKSEKKDILNRLRKGEIDVLIGTHAMLEDNVEFANIGLVITDEQHRFGVNQRKCLQNKGQSVDVLYMSATPIPRTYALTIYGDMDISIIKEKPAGRKEIATKVCRYNEMSNIAESMKKELENHHQIYVVAPLIEETSESELNDINSIVNLLNEHLDIKWQIGIMHGKMKSTEKEKVMNDFKNGKTDILVSTTVIEVGVDVKNATMMIIFNAERFGLATLHQLRGRIGRNELDSTCILISDKDSERLNVLTESNDGFYISEKDFELRGSGDLFGIRQSGDMIFKIANLRTDYRILLQCKEDTEKFINENIENNFRDYPYYSQILKQLINND